MKSDMLPVSNRTKIRDIVPMIIYSNPTDTGRLRLDVEIGGIDRTFKEIGVDARQITKIHAANRRDIFDALSEKKYSVIQFSGHGEVEGIFLEDDRREGCVLVDINSIKEILRAAKPNLVLVIFLSCYSTEMAESLLEDVPIIISVDGPASDRGCAEFIKYFYKFIYRLDGSISRAFMFAQLAVKENIKASMFRRALHGKCDKMLVVHPSYQDQDLLIDTSKAEISAAKLGLNCETFYHLLSTKLRYHLWAFRFSRQRVIFPVGSYFCIFSWENAEDCVECEKVLRIKDDVDEDLAILYSSILISYHDCCVSEYRSPYWNQSEIEKIEEGLETLTRKIYYYFNNENNADILRKYVKKGFVSAKSLCISNIDAANEKFLRGMYLASIPHMEAALSSLHDLIDEISSVVLE